MLAIRTLILTQLATVLVAEAWDRSKKTGKQHSITVDAYSGHDEDAKRFVCDDQLVGGGDKRAVEQIVTEALEYDAVHLFIDGPDDNVANGHGPWVYVIFGNGNGDLDMISDYSTELDAVVDPLNTLTDGIEKGTVKLAIAA